MKTGLCRLTCAMIAMVFLVTVPASAVTTITHWHNAWTHEGILRYLEEMKPLFEAENPDIKVELLTIAGGEYASKLIISVAAGVGPDVVEWYVASDTAEMVMKGMFLDLNPLVERDKINLRDFIPISIRTYQWSGKMWGFPYSGYPFMTFYNPQLFEEAGLVSPYALGDDWTWDAVAQAARRLTILKSGETTPIQYGVQFVWYDPVRLGIWVHQSGGGFFDNPIDPKQAKFTSPEAIRAITWVNDLTQAGLTSPTNNYDELITNTTAIILHGGTYVFGRQAFQPTPGQLSMPVGVARMPRGPVHNGTFFISDAWMITATSKSQEAAWKWLKFIGMDAERARRFAQLTGRLPTLIRALPDYVNLLPKGVLNGHTIVDATLAANTGVGVLLSPVAKDIRASFRTHMENVRQGTDSPEGALAKIQEEVTVQLARLLQ